MNKYRAKKTVVDGLTFDSKAEAKRYVELTLLAAKNEIYALDRQVRFTLYGEHGTNICTYIADFHYMRRHPEGSVERVVEDVKGVITPAFRLKAKLFLDNYGFPITIYPPRKESKRNARTPEPRPVRRPKVRPRAKG